MGIAAGYCQYVSGKDNSLRDHATAKSDIDLLVDSGLRGLAFFGLLEDVSTAIDAPIDLLDVSQIEKNSRIDREIQESGVEIYG